MKRIIVFILSLLALSINNASASETSVRQYLDSHIGNLHPVEGIWQSTDGFKYGITYYRLRNGSKVYSLEILSTPHSVYSVGSYKGYISEGSNDNIYSLEYYVKDWYEYSNGRIEVTKSYKENLFLIAESSTLMKFSRLDGKEILLYKLYPKEGVANNSNNSSNTTISNWSGTGFALKGNYLVTNYHVIEDAKSIWIQGVNGDFNTKHTASVVATDKFNDLALLKIEGVTVNTSGIPYSVKTSTSEVGEDVFVLGYPLTSTMGEEIKLTTGVVSSKTGFQGDVSLYQISAPIQPGNSGGPLFDGNGNVIGIVSAKHKGAENVGYAIKASYLRNLMESALSENILPQINKIATYKLSDKVKSLKNYVYYITCSSSSNSQSATISSNNTNHSSSPSAKAYPSIRTTGGTLAVTGVEIKANETVLSLASTNNLSGGWMNISKGAHIIANGIKYTLVRVEGITYEPEYTYFAYQGETKNFKLYFQAIPQGTQTIDFIESSSSAWKIYGIPVK